MRFRNREFGKQLVYKSRDEARSGFEASGLNAALRAQGLDPSRIRNETNNALDAGREKTILVLGDSGEQGSPGARARGPQHTRGPTGPVR